MTTYRVVDGDGTTITEGFQFFEWAMREARRIAAARYDAEEPASNREARARDVYVVSDDPEDETTIGPVEADPIVVMARQVASALAALDNTEGPNRVAARLNDRGIRGVLRKPCACPVSVYLAQHGATLGASWVASVGSSVVSVTDGRGYGVSVDLPAPVSQFVGAFDDGRFPFLVVAE
jgi:hypothetical protein